jgi:CDP-ribitol ribitolphosphotransferase
MILIMKIGIAFFQVIYSVLKLFPTKNKMLFLSRQMNHPSVDFSMLGEVMAKEHPDWDVVMLCRKIEPGLKSKISYVFHMFRQAYELATSRVLILDSYAILPCCLHHKKSLLIIQIWHSVGTMKKAGYSSLDSKEGRSSKVAHALHMHEQYDYVLAASDAYKQNLADQFHQDPERIVTLALPRIQLLKDPEYASGKREEIIKRHPKLANPGKKNILYCPTFRKNEDETIEFQHAIEGLLQSIDLTKYNLIVKLHPLTNYKIPKQNGVIRARKFTTFEMLFVSDIVISDYSCIIYEAAVRNIPLYFYAYDYEKYIETRGLFIDYLNEVPGPVCYTAEEIADALEKPYDMERLKMFADKYVSPENHDEAKSIIDFALSHLKS